MSTSKNSKSNWDLISNTIRNKITKNSLQNNSDIDSQIEEKSIKIPKNICISPKKKTKTADY